MEQEFDVRLDVLQDGAVVVHVQGDLDMATTPRVEDALARMGSPQRLVVDLRECTFVDSAAIRLLTQTAREVEESGATASVVATDPSIRRVLEITAVDTVLPVHSTLDAALA